MDALDDTPPPSPGTSPGLPAVIERLSRHAANLTGVHGAGVLLLDEDGALRTRAAIGIAARALGLVEELYGDGPCHEAVVVGRVVATSGELARWPRLAPLLAATPIRRVVAAPIAWDGLPIGALYAISEDAHPWADAGVEELEAVAAHLAREIRAGLDSETDELAGRIRAALTNRPVLAQATAVISGQFEVPVVEAGRRLRQLSASTGAAAVRVARRIIAEGRIPLLHEIGDAATERTHREELARLALTDPLTGLANRVLLLDRLEHAVWRSQRSAGRPAVLYIDLDGFKVINDSMGHGVGDHVLRTAAGRIAAAVRPQDTVGRLGGDEFAVVCEAVGDADAAVEIATRIVAALSEPIALERALSQGPDPAVPPTVGASIGIAVAGAGQPAAEVLRDADMAMYRSKLGGEQITVFCEEIRVAGTRRMRIETGLRVAVDHLDVPGRKVEDTQLRLEYQPVIELATHRVIGLEALVRWTHPELGPIPATELIRVAESLGLMRRLGAALLEEACTTAAGWPLDEGFDLAVNVSATQLADPAFGEVVLSALSVSGLPARRLCLELTESNLLEAAGTAVDTLAKLRGAGIHLALDDFGTGYSSLAYLAHLPITTLKLDREFVSALGSTPNTTVMARAVIELARDLGLRTVAEGVETDDQEQRLIALDCDRVQGFLYSRSVPPDEVPELITDGGYVAR